MGAKPSVRRPEVGHTVTSPEKIGIRHSLCVPTPVYVPVERRTRIAQESMILPVVGFKRTGRCILLSGSHR